MNEKLRNSIENSDSLLDSRSNRMEVNALVAKMIRTQYHRSLPINSSKSQKFIDSKLNEEIQFAYNKVDHLRTKRPSKTLISTNCKSPLTIKKSDRSSVLNMYQQARRNKELRHSLDSVQSLMQSEVMSSKNLKNCTSKSSLSRILGSYQKLDDILEKTKPNVISLGISKIGLHKKSKTMLKTDVEKNLHEEYMKDRFKFKLGNSQYICNKVIWRPDCLKTIRKAEKLLDSLPKTRV